jgi:hypothetical protein
MEKPMNKLMSVIEGMNMKTTTKVTDGEQYTLRASGKL